MYCFFFITKDDTLALQQTTDDNSVIHKQNNTYKHNYYICIYAHYDVLLCIVLLKQRNITLQFTSTIVPNTNNGR